MEMQEHFGIFYILPKKNCTKYELHSETAFPQILTRYVPNSSCPAFTVLQEKILPVYHIQFLLFFGFRAIIWNRNIPVFRLYRRYCYDYQTHH